MKALKIEKPFKIFIDDYPTPELMNGYTLLKVSACGLCGTDLKIYHGETEANYPIVPGHEIVGEVVKSDVYAPGTKVVVDPNSPCGVCDSCRQGRPHLCESLEATGVTRDGGFAEFVLVKNSQVYPLGNVPVNKAVFAEPLSCVLHGLDLVGNVHVSDVLVVGGGPIGSIFAILIDRFSVGKLFLIEVEEKRGEFLKEVILKNSRAEVIEHSPEDKFDVVVEASGSVKGLKSAFEHLKPGGKLLIFGVPSHRDSLNFRPFDVYKHEYTIMGSYVNPLTMSKAVKILQGSSIIFENLVTDVLDLQGLIGYIEGHRTPLMKAVYTN